MVENDNFIWKKARTGKLRTACAAYIELLECKYYNGDRIKVYQDTVFRKAMELFYGENVWERVCKAMGGAL